MPDPEGEAGEAGKREPEGTEGKPKGGNALKRPLISQGGNPKPAEPLGRPMRSRHQR